MVKDRSGRRTKSADGVFRKERRAADSFFPYGFRRKAGSAGCRGFSYRRYIIAVGGAGSSGLPAAEMGSRIINKASSAITTRPAR
jgi:hypothetical protein